VTDNGSGAVLAVDLSSGDRTILSAQGTGAGPEIIYPYGVVVDGTRSLVVDMSQAAVMTVDLASGDRRSWPAIREACAPLAIAMGDLPWTATERS
jgi:hypothetical protein